MTFVVASNSLAQQRNWISVSKVFKTQSDSEILKAAESLHLKILVMKNTVPELKN